MRVKRIDNHEEGICKGRGTLEHARHSTALRIEGMQRSKRTGFGSVELPIANPVAVWAWEFGTGVRGSDRVPKRLKRVEAERAVGYLQVWYTDARKTILVRPIIIGDVPSFLTLYGCDSCRSGAPRTRHWGNEGHVIYGGGPAYR